MLTQTGKEKLGNALDSLRWLTTYAYDSSLFTKAEADKINEVRAIMERKNAL